MENEGRLKLHNKSQNFGNCTTAAAIVPAGVAPKFVPTSPVVGYKNFDALGFNGWTYLPHAMMGAGAFPYACWMLDIGDTPIPGDPKGRRVVTIRLMNWSNTTEIFGKFQLEWT